MHRHQDDGTIFIPLKTLQQIFGMEGQLTSIGIKVDKNADLAQFEEKMLRLPDVQVFSLTQVKMTIMTLVSTAHVLVFSIALIAILISVMGVINKILMSVMERQKVIGILKAMGALRTDIFKLIWTETTILCFLGEQEKLFWPDSVPALLSILFVNFFPFLPAAVWWLSGKAYYYGHCRCSSPGTA